MIVQIQQTAAVVLASCVLFVMAADAAEVPLIEKLSWVIAVLILVSAPVLFLSTILRIWQ